MEERGMTNDLRGTELYLGVREHFRRALEPGFGSVSWAEDLAPSPDGRTVAFTGTRFESLERDPSSRICSFDVHEGTVEEITTGPNDDHMARWSADGELLGFLSDRAVKGTDRLYLLRRDGVGEASEGPELSGDVEYFEWAPAGRSLLLGVAGEGVDKAGVQGSGPSLEDRSEAPEWLPESRSTAGSQQWRSAWLFDLDSGSLRRVSGEKTNVWECTWAGPGALAAVVSDDPGEGAWYEARLVTIDLRRGTESTVYESDVQLGSPCTSASGTRVAVIRAVCSDRMVLAGDLVVIDQADGATHVVDARGVDVTHAVWRDERRLVFSGLRNLDTVVAEYDVDNRLVVERWVGEDTCGGPLYPSAHPLGGDEGIVLVRQGYERPPEINVIGRESEGPGLAPHDGHRYITDVNGSLERPTWKAEDGTEIHGLLCLPNRPAPHPLVLFVHGGPIAAHRNSWSLRSQLVPLLVARGFAVLCPNPRGSTGKGQEFAARVIGDMGGADAGDLLAGVDFLVARGIADPERLGVTGGSYGGFMTAWLVTRTSKFAAAVAISPVTDWYSQHFGSNIGAWDQWFLGGTPPAPGGAYYERSPVMHAERAATPTLVTAGALDRCTPPGQAIEFFQALSDKGVEAELAVYPREGHGVRHWPAVIDFSSRVAGWFETHMSPQ
jgi:dipeptidyl aminopeptidase/acylaminoacyl peptidase